MHGWTDDGQRPITIAHLETPLNGGPSLNAGLVIFCDFSGDPDQYCYSKVNKGAKIRNPIIM